MAPLVEGLKNEFLALEEIKLRSYITDGYYDVSFTIDYGDFKHLRRLTAYDICPASWETLEGCPDLEFVNLEYAGEEGGRLPDPLGLNHRVTLRALRELAIACKFQQGYRLDFVEQLITDTTMPSLRTISLDIAHASSVADAETVIVDLFARHQEIEEVVLQDDGTATSIGRIIHELGLRRGLRKLEMSVTSDHEVVLLTGRLSKLEVLHLHYRRLATSDGISPGILVHIAESCPALRDLKIDLTCSRFPKGGIRVPPHVASEALRRLSITTIGLWMRMVDDFARFLAALFPALGAPGFEVGGPGWEDEVEARASLVSKFSKIKDPL